MRIDLSLFRRPTQPAANQVARRSADRPLRAAGIAEGSSRRLSKEPGVIGDSLAKIAKMARMTPQGARPPDLAWRSVA
jgi:hypothetical protein